MTTKLKFDGCWCATVTDEPLDLVPRLLGTFVIVSPYVDRVEREKFLTETFGSQDWLWDDPDVFRFDPSGRQLVGAEFQMPEESASAEDSARLPVRPAVRPGGLRADEVSNFRHEMCTVLCRAPGDAMLTCLRDLDVLDEPLEARIGIAPDVALLVQQGAVVGWSLTDPARYLTPGFAAPDPDPPSPATCRLLTECLDLVTSPLVDDVVDGEPAALTRLRAADEALRAQHEDRHRADALLNLIATYVEDYAT
ncbi:hypothetical protein AQI88_37270 [Streptomyces cellostaticus]|uniref:Uncharacterized protein n=1 Tax=Streptomyces cellostaticus TaxID=67285 RepID=A0A101NDX6_9ACTN|nr:hypothetical protein [Streptomyces cellostaticus]KUM91405.1 hypothetical protein AQI88_37270 [Streptomyces cellostaticus]GHI04540.1 hypothetical protein Scel_28610 [Streptomyces cellostaticus]